MEQNFEVNDNFAQIKIKKSIYSKEVLFQCAYVKIDEYYVLIDEDSQNYLMNIRFKDSSKNNSKDLQVAVFEFFDELIESASYIQQLKKTSKIRETILERALLTQVEDSQNNESKK